MEPFQYKLFYYKTQRKINIKRNKGKKVTFNPEITIIPIKKSKRNILYEYVNNILSIFSSNANSYKN